MSTLVGLVVMWFYHADGREEEIRGVSFELCTDPITVTIIGDDEEVILVPKPVPERLLFVADKKAINLHAQKCRYLPFEEPSATVRNN